MNRPMRTYAPGLAAPTPVGHNYKTGATHILPRTNRFGAGLTLPAAKSRKRAKR